MGVGVGVGEEIECFVVNLRWAKTVGGQKGGTLHQKCGSSAKNCGSGVGVGKGGP